MNHHYDSVVRRTIVCLCGSTRFSEAFRKANLEETLAGRIVLTIGCDFKTGFALGFELEVKERLDKLHLDKIAMADEILVLNVDGYIGESTRREITYAQALGKKVRWLKPLASDLFLTPSAPLEKYLEEAPPFFFKQGTFDWGDKVSQCEVPAPGEGQSEAVHDPPPTFIRYVLVGEHRTPARVLEGLPDGRLRVECCHGRLSGFGLLLAITIRETDEVEDCEKIDWLRATERELRT